LGIFVQELPQSSSCRSHATASGSPQACSKFKPTGTSYKGTPSCHPGKDCPETWDETSTQWTCRKGFRMNYSNRLASPRAAGSLPASASTDRFGASLVGWLIQTAFISVMEGTCETYYGSRGSIEGRFSRGLRLASRLRIATGARRLQQRKRSQYRKFVFALSFTQHALISKVWGRESKLSKFGHVTGHVAGRRHSRRVVPK
jgi:hypothetical protein